MSQFIRKNVWLNGGTFDNPDLLWYAKAVKVMQSRSLDDPTSWWFFAAIHGEMIASGGWKTIPGPPAVPVTPLPDASVRSKYWNQCQHQSWFFPPWHRGYLIALEGQIRAIVIELGGPADWALPYWDYLTPGETEIPPAFRGLDWPGSGTNPLYVNARYGNGGNSGNRRPAIISYPVSDACQKNTVYTGSSSSTPGYGGLKTGFSHGGGTSGNLEMNPHNYVHVQVGGTGGVMSNPATAGLDPIFYLHHCNIDRMWAAWNASGNRNPADAAWLNGPAASGGRAFVMPMPDGSPWAFTPAEVNSLDQLDYEYEGLQITAPLIASRGLSERLVKLGAAPIDSLTEMPIQPETNSELIGANNGTLKVRGLGAHTTVQFDAPAFKHVSRSLTEASASNLPDRVFLQLEQVRGTEDGHILTVAVNQEIAGHVPLFGLSMASEMDGEHGGEGLTFLLEITDIVDNLHLENNFTGEPLNVTILPDSKILDENTVTVGRISIYREKQ